MDLQEYLDQLVDGSTRLKVTDLQRLSGLAEDRLTLVRSRWPDIDVRRRRRIVQELYDLSEDNIEFNFDALFQIGLADEDSEVRLGSVRGLWEHEGTDLIEPLLGLLGADADDRVRAEAALALGRFVTMHEEGRLRDRYFEAIEDGLRKTLDNVDETVDVRARALEAIGSNNEQWVRDAIRIAYESDVQRLKVSAVHAMGRSCDDRWLPLLVRELSNDDAEVRYEAAVAAGELGDERAIPHLAKLVLDPDAEVKQAAITALGEIGGAQARAALQLLLESESEATREAARDALALLDFEEDPLAFKQRL
jgi:HEAT repeat protein